MVGLEIPIKETPRFLENLTQNMQDAFLCEEAFASRA